MVDVSRFEGHTPGPWAVYLSARGHEIMAEKPSCIEEVLAPPGGYEARESKIHPGFLDIPTANLVAAAPRLLEERNRLLALAKEMESVLMPSDNLEEHQLTDRLTSTIAFCEEERSRPDA